MQCYCKDTGYWKSHYNTKTHDHPTDTLIFANRIKRVTGHQIFEKFTQSVVLLQEHLLYRLRQLKVPCQRGVGLICQNYHHLRNNFLSNHRLTIREGNETAVLFASDQVISRLKVADCSLCRYF